MQYTLRNVSKQVDRSLRAKAKAEGKSLNAIALELIERGLGLAKKPKVYHDLDHLFGANSFEPEVLKAIQDADVVHPDEWK